MNDPQVKKQVCEDFTKARDDNPEGSRKKTFGSRAADKRLNQIASKKLGMSMGPTGSWKSYQKKNKKDMYQK